MTISKLIVPNWKKKTAKSHKLICWLSYSATSLRFLNGCKSRKCLFNENYLHNSPSTMPLKLMSLDRFFFCLFCGRTTFFCYFVVLRQRFMYDDMWGRIDFMLRHLSIWKEIGLTIDWWATSREWTSISCLDFFFFHGQKHKK